MSIWFKLDLANEGFFFIISVYIDGSAVYFYTAFSKPRTPLS